MENRKTDTEMLEAGKCLLEEAKNIPLFTPEEERECAVRLKSKDTDERKQARDEMVLHNIRLVAAVAKKYEGVSSLDFSDLMQEGMIGLIRAADMFDYTLENKFSTYAVFWIRQSISHSIVNTAGTIRLPEHAYGDHIKIKRFMDSYYEKHRKYPTDAEIAKEVGISKDSVKYCRDDINQMPRLDAVVPGEHDSSDTTLGEMVAGQTPPVESDILEEEMKKQIENVMQELKPHEKEVLELRFGFGGNKPMTFEAIGQKMGVSKERIRQIEVRALQRLKHSKKAYILKDYVK